MATFVLRVALVDRPGALGAVASRIGAVRGDVVAVEIVERGHGRAVDEFVVELADDAHLPLLLSEVTEVDGVVVEAAHPVPGGVRDGRIDAYDTASAIVAQHTPHDVLCALAWRARRDVDASWAAVVDVAQETVIASEGPVPEGPSVAAYVERCRQGESSRPGDDETHWVPLAVRDLALVLRRPGWPLGTRARDRMAALARLADWRWTDLSPGDRGDPSGAEAPRVEASEPPGGVSEPPRHEQPRAGAR